MIGGRDISSVFPADIVPHFDLEVQLSWHLQSKYKRVTPRSQSIACNVFIGKFGYPDRLTTLAEAMRGAIDIASSLEKMLPPFATSATTCCMEQILLATFDRVVYEGGGTTRVNKKAEIGTGYRERE